MDLSKLTRAHVIAIGAVVAVILGVVWYFLGPAKVDENLKTLKGRSDQAQSIVATKPQKVADLKAAKKEVAEANAVWSKTDRTQMPKPPIDLTKSDEKSLT